MGSSYPLDPIRGYQPASQPHKKKKEKANQLKVVNMERPKRKRSENFLIEMGPEKEAKMIGHERKKTIYGEFGLNILQNLFNRYVYKYLI